MMTKIIFLIGMFALFGCGNKSGERPVKVNPDTLKHRENRVTTRVRETPVSKTQIQPNPIDSGLAERKASDCTENKECLEWNLKNSWHSFYHDTIPAYLSKRNFVEKGFSQLCWHDSVFPISYDLNFLQEYDSSAVKTGEWDGKIFCLNKSFIEDGVQMRVVYSRNEGGHLSDLVSIYTLSKDLTDQFRLDILSEFGKDGYTSRVEGEILSERLFRRKIYEEFGWDTYGDICPKPKRTTVQVFKITNTGRFELVDEKIETENFHLYLE